MTNKKRLMYGLEEKKQYVCLIFERTIIIHPIN